MAEDKTEKQEFGNNRLGVTKKSPHISSMCSIEKVEDNEYPEFENGYTVYYVAECCLVLRSCDHAYKRVLLEF